MQKRRGQRKIQSGLLAQLKVNTSSKEGKVITSFQMNIQFETVLKMLLFYIVHIALAEWCRERRLPSNLLTMTFESLDNVLRQFYAEARTKKGEEYSRLFLLGIRNALERHLAANRREVKITKNPLFMKSNKMLECKLKLNRRKGKGNVKHKLKGSQFLSFNDPAGLLR